MHGFKAFLSRLPWRKQKHAGTHALLDVVPIEFSVHGYPVVVYQSTFDTVSAAVGLDRTDDIFSYLYDRPPSVSPEEVESFMDFFLQTRSAQILLKSNRFGAVGICFVVWQRLNGPQDKYGKLKDSIQCIGFNNGQVRCANMTKSVSGRCRHHTHADASTIWNTDWYSETEESLRVQKMRSEHIERQRIERKLKWEAIAKNIVYTATDRQIYLLLDLGATPRRLNNIDKRGASLLIDKLLNS